MVGVFGVVWVWKRMYRMWVVGGLDQVGCEGWSVWG